jgi:drug/metabolite transporter (DMT)-like permease
MGEIYALSCSLIWSFAVILFQRSGERVSPLALNLFRSSVSVLLLLPTLFLAGQSLLQPAPLRDYLLLIASGILGIAFADTLFHASLNRIGSGLSAIASTTYSPLIVLMAYFMLGERLRPLDLCGMRPRCVRSGVSSCWCSWRSSPGSGERISRSTGHPAAGARCCRGPRSVPIFRSSCGSRR